MDVACRDMPLPVRSATAGDAEAIATVQVESWQHAYRHILAAEFLANLSTEERRAMWAEAIARDSPHVLVAEANNRIAGFAAIGPSRDDGASSMDFEIWSIYVSPACWSQGLGRELWHAARKASAERGARRIPLWVFANNPRAIKFYRQAGFEPEADSLRRFDLGGVQVEEIRYVRSLDGQHLQRQPSEDRVEFRLICEGPLQGQGAKSPAQWQIRRALHRTFSGVRLQWNPAQNPPFPRNQSQITCTSFNYRPLMPPCIEA